MNNDLISRSALRAEIESYVMPILTNNLMGASDAYYRIMHLLDGAPAVDAETVFEQIGLVKEAFEMAKADLVTVVRCKDCEAWKTKTAMSFLRDGVHVRCCSCGVYGRLMYEDDFCSKGKRRADA